MNNTIKEVYQNYLEYSKLKNKLTTVQHEYYKKNYPNYNEDFFLFGGNKPISTTTLERKKNEYCKLAGVKQIRIHDLRHSHATILYNKKVKVKTIQERLGHADISTTLNTYVHTDIKEQKRLIKKINLLRMFHWLI